MRYLYGLLLLLAISATALAQGGIGPGPGTPHTTAAVYYFSPVGLGTTRNDLTASAGLTFTTDSTPRTVTSLCRWKLAGNSQTHPVYLVEVTPFSIIETVSVDLSTGSDASWVCTALSSPRTLATTHIYGLMSGETASGDQWYDADTTIASPYATIISALYDLNVPPTGTVPGPAGGFTYGPVNMVLQ